MKLLVVKLSSLGDLFRPLPAVHALKTALGAEIHWVTQEEYVPLVECFTDVDEVIPFPRRGFLSKLPALRRRLRPHAYDAVLDFQGLLKSAIVCAMAKAKKKIGPSFHREGSGIFYNEIAGRRDRTRHSVDECLDLARHLGAACDEPVFPVSFPKIARDEPRPRVALLPVSRWPTKNWPVECFAEVGRRLRQAGAASLFILGGSADTAACGDLASRLDGAAVDLSGRTTLTGMGSLLQEMDLLVANDSGPVHLAAALGIPVLCVYGPTDPARTGPYGQGHTVLTADVDCRPCFSRSCRRDGIPCLSGVTPGKVAETALNMLG